MAILEKSNSFKNKVIGSINAAVYKVFHFIHARDFLAEFLATFILVVRFLQLTIVIPKSIAMNDQHYNV